MGSCHSVKFSASLQNKCECLCFRQIINHLQRTKKVAVTASTGMASLQYEHGCTIYHWSAYGDGHLNADEVIHQLKTNAQYESTLEAIHNTQVLFIDEIGMLSMHIFNSVEKICREVRGNTMLFGGLQVIGSGCFRQLSPVPSNIDDRRYCFESQVFTLVFPHIFQLTEVMHQKEIDLIVAINELCIGSPSGQTCNLLCRLKRPLQRGVKATYIFGTNNDVDVFNDDQLDKIPGTCKSYTSLDKGDKKYLKKVTAPKKLKLKEGCKVIVLRNLPNGLVNGITGLVTLLNDDDIRIVVQDDGNIPQSLCGKEFKIEQYNFLVRDASNAIVASRLQYPLKLGYAITVDKSQGKTLTHVVDWIRILEGKSNGCGCRQSR